MASAVCDRASFYVMDQEAERTGEKLALVVTARALP